MANNELRNYINLAQKAGLILLGLDQVKPLINKDKVSLILYSSNVGKSTKRQIEIWRNHLPGVVFAGMSDLKEVLAFADSGRVKVLGFKKSPLTDEIIKRVTAYWSNNGK